MRVRLPQGIVCPLATPLNDDERLDQPALGRLLDFILPDVDGLLVLGSSGEFSLLRPEVSEQVIEAVVAHVDDRVPVYVGIGDTGTERTLSNMKRISQPGVECVVATSSYYYPVNDQLAMQRHFLTLADAARVPLILYNIPQNTASNLTPDSVAVLAEHPNVVGIKDSWGDMFQFQEFLAVRPPGFPVLQGREQLAAVSLWLGADGIISALSNIAPRLLQQVKDAVKSGESQAATRAQREVTRVASLFDQGYWLSALKVAIAELGFGSGRAARPIPELSAEQVARVRALVPREVLHG